MTKKKDLNVTRRAALLGMAGAAGTVLARSAAGQEVQVSGSNRPVAPEDPTKVPGSRWSSKLGRRSPYEALLRVPSPTLSSSETPLQDLHGTITPAHLHFERHHAGVPFIDPQQHKLVIHGAPRNPRSPPGAPPPRGCRRPGESVLRSPPRPREPLAERPGAPCQADRNRRRA